LLNSTFNRTSVQLVNETINNLYDN